MRVFHGTTTAFKQLLEQKALLCKLLQEGAKEEFERQLKVYRASYKPGVNPIKRLLDLMEKNYPLGVWGDESATHVFVTRKLNQAFKMAGSGRKPESIVLEFNLAKKEFELKPLYFSKEHKKLELYVPGKIDFSKLVAIKCRPERIAEHKKLLEASGLGHVRVTPFKKRE